eukprot:GFYU01006318.1.p1 GENE.GFYU01006318.1~~GFYU01006318.1.p1  ORF type:complete len:963 (-),score=154.56 GFYU01006318.1:61-2949(-)
MLTAVVQESSFILAWDEYSSRAGTICLANKLQPCLHIYSTDVTSPMHTQAKTVQIRDSGIIDAFETYLEECWKGRQCDYKDKAEFLSKNTYGSCNAVLGSETKAIDMTPAEKDAAVKAARYVGNINFLEIIADEFALITLVIHLEGVVNDDTNSIRLQSRLAVVSVPIATLVNPEVTTLTSDIIQFISIGRDVFVSAFNDTLVYRFQSSPKPLHYIPTNDWVIQLRSGTGSVGHVPADKFDWTEVKSTSTGDPTSFHGDVILLKQTLGRSGQEIMFVASYAMVLSTDDLSRFQFVTQHRYKVDAIGHLVGGAYSMSASGDPSMEVVDNSMVIGVTPQGVGIQSVKVVVSQGSDDRCSIEAVANACLSQLTTSSILGGLSSQVTGRGAPCVVVCSEVIASQGGGSAAGTSERQFEWWLVELPSSGTAVMCSDTMMMSRLSDKLRWEGDNYGGNGIPIKEGARWIDFPSKEMVVVIGAAEGGNAPPVASLSYSDIRGALDFQVASSFLTEEQKYDMSFHPFTSARAADHALMELAWSAGPAGSDRKFPPSRASTIHARKMGTAGSRYWVIAGLGAVPNDLRSPSYKQLKSAGDLCDYLGSTLWSQTTKSDRYDIDENWFGDFVQQRRSTERFDVLTSDRSASGGQSIDIASAQEQGWGSSTAFGFSFNSPYRFVGVVDVRDDTTAENISSPVQPPSPVDLNLFPAVRDAAGRLYWKQRSTLIVAIDPTNRDRTQGIAIPNVMTGKWYFRTHGECQQLIAWHESVDNQPAYHMHSLETSADYESRMRSSAAPAANIRTYWQRKGLMPRSSWGPPADESTTTEVDPTADNVTAYTESVTLPDGWMPLIQGLHSDAETPPTGLFDAERYRDVSALPRLPATYRFRRDRGGQSQISNDRWLDMVIKMSGQDAAVSLPHGCSTLSSGTNSGSDCHSVQVKVSGGSVAAVRIVLVPEQQGDTDDVEMMTT